MPPFLYDFSVIIATRNRPALLRDCVAALGQSSYPPERFEVIVADSSDASLASDVAELGARMPLKLLRCSPRGPAAARNAGALHANGRFIAFTDDDMQPDREWLPQLSRHLFNMPGDLVGGAVVNGLPSSACSTAYHLVLNTAYEYFNPAKGRSHFFATGNMAMATERFRELNGFGDWSLYAAEDRAFCWHWLERGWPMRYLPEAMVTHRHVLDLWSFMELYFRYGRGAYRYRALRASTGHGRLNPDWRFYALCFRRAFSRPEPVSPLQLVLLLCLWQLMNACGYFSEWFADRLGHRGR